MGKKKQEQSMEEKAKIFDILKFTPIDCSITIWGYGGDSYFIKANKEQLKYFQQNNIDIEDFAHDWDGSETNVPEEFQPFPPGQPYDGSMIECCSGATMDDSSHLEITDDKGNVIFKCTMDPHSLSEEGVHVEEVNEFYVHSDCKKGDVVVWHGNGEKGTFFDTNYRLTAPFNPNNLHIQYIDMDGWAILLSVSYEDEELDNGGYSTTGKWSETKWIVVGQDDLEFDEDIIPEHLKTDWFPASEVNPVRKGTYECMFGGTDAWPFATLAMVEYNGKKWVTENQINQWRGLNEDGVKFLRVN